MFSNLFKTKTFWIAVAAAGTALCTLFGADIKWDFTSIGGLVDTAQAVWSHPAWTQLLAALGGLTFRHSMAKSNMAAFGCP